VGGVDLHGIESGLLRAAGGAGKGGYDGRNIVPVRLTARYQAVLLDSGRPDKLQAGQPGISVASPVDQLQGNLPARRMDGPGHLPKPGQEAVIADGQLTGTGLSFRTYERITADDQAHPTPRQFNHHLGKLRGDGAIMVCQSFPGCGPDKSVGKHHAAQGRLFE
jgi:hypothetical protein